jgi:hypothetical protein
MRSDVLPVTVMSMPPELCRHYVSLYTRLCDYQTYRKLVGRWRWLVVSHSTLYEPCTSSVPVRSYVQTSLWCQAYSSALLERAFDPLTSDQLQARFLPAVCDEHQRTASNIPRTV